MQAYTTRIIAAAAEAAGLPEGRVMTLSRMDNLTIKRPRIELQWLPETYRRTGRALGHRRTGWASRDVKRELYEIHLPVSANILADDGPWLSGFIRDVLVALPRGANDDQGNYVRIRAERAEWLNQGDTRVGTKTIKVMPKAAHLLVIGFTWRVTATEAQHLIPSLTFNQKGHDHG